MSRLKFGAFIAPHHPIGEHPMLQMRNDIRLAKHLDELGFDEFWVGDYNPLGRVNRKGEVTLAFYKLNASNRQHAVAKAIARGILTPRPF